jgi:hypothetical protein
MTLALPPTLARLTQANGPGSITPGTADEAVLRQLLGAAGVTDAGGLDGAVRSFQQRFNAQLPAGTAPLAVDGRAGAETLRALSTQLAAGGRDAVDRSPWVSAFLSAPMLGRDAGAPLAAGTIPATELGALLRGSSPEVAHARLVAQTPANLAGGARAPAPRVQPRGGEEAGVGVGADQVNDAAERAAKEARRLSPADAARAAATEAVDDAARAATDVVDDVARAADAAPTVGRRVADGVVRAAPTIAKAGGVVGLVTAGVELTSAVQQDRARADGRFVETERATGRVAGGLGGAWAGGAAAAALFAWTGPGALVAGAIGAAAGGLLGSFGGGKAVEGIQWARGRMNNETAVA